MVLLNRQSFLSLGGFDPVLKHLRRLLSIGPEGFSCGAFQFILTMANLITYGGSYLIDNLCEGRLSVSSIRDVNDPFELHHRPGGGPTDDEFETFLTKIPETWLEATNAGHSLPPPPPGMNADDILRALRSDDDLAKSSITLALETHINAMRQRSVDVHESHFRAICCVPEVVAPIGEITMWAHYGQRHTGIRIHLRPSFHHYEGVELREMRYQEEPPELGFQQAENPDEFINNVKESKAWAWSHERETRLLIPLQLLQDGKDCKDIDRKWMKVKREDVARVDLGFDFNNDVVQVRKLLNAFPNLDIRKAFKSETAYRFDYRKLNVDSLAKI